MIYQIKIETNSEEDWLRLRGIFDSPLTHPMCFPYFYESKAINAWSRQIKINRDEEFVKEKNRHRSEAKIDAVEVAKFIDNHSTDSEAIDMITSLMNGEYTVQAMRQDFLESDGSIYFGSKETQGIDYPEAKQDCNYSDAFWGKCDLERGHNGGHSNDENRNALHEYGGSPMTPPPRKTIQKKKR